MNRLIMIGNGFDLAHGLKTSFKDFVEDYLETALNESFEKSGFFEDELIKLSIKLDPLLDYSESFFIDVKKKGILKILIESIANKSIEITFCNRFIEDIVYKSHNLGWVDIEYEYFDHLKILKRAAIKNLKIVPEFNNKFEVLKKKLITYLIKATDCEKPYIDEYRNLICEDFDIREFSLDANVRNREPTIIYFLNFNYTDTVQEYLQDIPYDGNNSILKMNYIHGTLNDNSYSFEYGFRINDQIFGFGDEYNEDYKEFENIENKELSKHIKSTRYASSTNLFDLFQFIDSDKFQISIFGHSCGITDRTLLREIFEHENCKSIKIFYHLRKNKTNDFNEKVIDIYRHFTDKSLARRKIVPFPYCHPMPQLKNK